MNEVQPIFTHRLLTITLIEPGVVQYQRTREAPEQLSEMREAWRAALKSTDLDTQTHSLIIDTRAVIGRRDDEFENMTVEMMRQLQAQFFKVVVLQRSEVGKLHTQRLARRLDKELVVTLDEEEAIRLAKARVSKTS